MGAVLKILEEVESVGVLIPGKFQKYVIPIVSLLIVRVAAAFQGSIRAGGVGAGKQGGIISFALKSAKIDDNGGLWSHVGTRRHREHQQQGKHRRQQGNKLLHPIRSFTFLLCGRSSISAIIAQKRRPVTPAARLLRDREK
ncbi:hypothetical protein SDC9_120767 [bioreactor metagenome]|uniref:Uncharacterized protein n=1 Tax=bioreactor metagenome TaxID=1076179 RepID=A0A645CA46_9ZZZZ